MAFTVNGHADRVEHIKALMAQGMTESQARVAEVKALVAEAAKRRRATGKPSASEMYRQWAERNGVNV